MPPLRPLSHSPRPPLTTRSSNRYFSRSSNLLYVKVKRPPWFRRFASRVFFLGAAACTWNSFVSVQQDTTSRDVEFRSHPPDSSTHGDTRSNKTAKPHQSHSSPFFVPIGWRFLQGGKFYAASDPEWKTFVKISKDQKKIRELKDELASMVLTEASQSSLLSHMLGPPFTVSQQWLLHHFPPRAPPEYYQPGLEITDAWISWVWRPMSNENISKSVQPYFVALGVKDAYSILLGSFLDKFNTRDSEDGSALSLPDASSEALLPSDFTTLDKLGDASPPESQLFPPASPQNSASQTDADRHPRPSTILSTLQWLPLPKFGPGTDLHAASLAFKHRINECQKRELRASRRGTFSIRGPVGLSGSVGFCRIEVEGEYDPAASEWVSVSMYLKDIRSFKQKPLGGK